MNPVRNLRARFNQLSGRSRAVGMFFATSIAARGVGIVCQLLQVPVAVHALGSEAFGLWMALMSISYFITFADFGVGQGAQNKLAEAFAAEHDAEARRLWGTTLAFLALVGGILAAAVLAFAPRFDFVSIFHLQNSAVRAQALPAVETTLCIVCCNFPLGLAQRLAYSLQWGWMHNIAQAVGAVGGLCGILFAVHNHWTLPGIIAATQTPLLLANAGLIIFLLARLGWLDRLPECRRDTMRPLLKLGAYFGVQQVLVTLMISLPSVVISTGLGAAAVTPYNLAQRLFNFFAIIQNAIMLPLWPAYSDAKARGDYVWIRRTLFFSLRAGLFAVILPMAIGALVGRPVIRIWVGSGTELPSRMLIGALFLWNAAVFLQQPFGYFLAGLSEVRRLTFYAVISAALSASLMYLAVHRFGAAGTVLGMLVGYLPFLILGNITETARVLRKHGIVPGAVQPPLAQPDPVETVP
ncbi:MAG TPA: oligosaccharide flippase family protein [Opitutaceae bacterium]|nr:oligosaccharide flippase family protein [Opitutaceae bacterium]